MTHIGFVSTMAGYHPSVPRWAGCEELWGQAATELAKQGTDVSVNIHKWPEPVPQIEALKAAGCKVTERHAVRGMARFTKDARFRWLDQTQPDLVTITLHVQNDDLNWAQQCLKRKQPYALVIQSVCEWWPLDPQADEATAVYQGAERCYFLSPGNREMVERQLGVDLENVTIVRNPFKVPYNAETPWPETEDLRLACVGRLNPVSKGQDLLFEVLRAPKWRERPLRVTLFGNGPHRDRLMSLKRKHSLDNVEFGGFTDDIQKVWKDHQALILPSRLEGVPLAVVEAMLCGRPCIVTAVAGADLVQDGRSGFVAPAPTVELLDDALERAWQRKDEWRSMGKVASTSVRQAVPPDPGATFASELKDLAGARGRALSASRK